MHQPAVRIQLDSQHDQRDAVVGPAAPQSRNHRGRGRRGVVAVEAALVLTVVVPLMLGVWQVGRMVEVSRILQDAANTGARIAAGGNSCGTPATVAVVQAAVQNYLTAAGLPSAAVSGAQISVTNLSTDIWTDPCNALPLDPFSVTVTIPSGTALNSLFWGPSFITGINQLSASATWLSANDAKVVVNTTLPY
jgi:Flp pilus assembly protein TadG